jgi:hypothetical protein
MAYKGIIDRMDESLFPAASLYVRNKKSPS